MQKAWTFAAVLVFPAALLAQSTYGTLLGTVTDGTGAVVPQAPVSVTEITTNVVHSGVTNDRGDYEITNLLPGNYEVAVAAVGFKRFIRRGVGLEPRAEVRVDAALEVGVTGTAVEVTAAAPVITTETATVAEVEKNQELTQLPINFRGKSTAPSTPLLRFPEFKWTPVALRSAFPSPAAIHPKMNLQSTAFRFHRSETTGLASRCFRRVSRSPKSKSPPSWRQRNTARSATYPLWAKAAPTSSMARCSNTFKTMLWTPSPRLPTASPRSATTPSAAPLAARS